MAAAAALARCHWPRFSDSHISAAVISSIEFLDSIRSFLIGGHLNEAKALAAARIAISNDLGGLNTSRLSEDFLKCLVRRAERQITNVKLLTHVPPSEPERT